ncbi:MAG: alpha/beta hydrolase [Pseudomonadota bacterium]
MDWDAAYSNVDAVANSDVYPPRWAAAGAAFRAKATRAHLDIAYGTAPREKLDLFLPESTPIGLAVFVHGGYWRRFEKESYSQVAAGALAHGWAAAVVGYTLCPEIRISGITAQVGAAIACAAQEVAGPIRLAGHSAGGHLVSRMACQDGPLPANVAGRLEHVLTISGLHDLRPLLRLEINEILGLDADEATAESPALSEPLPGTCLTAWVGDAELPEFVRQNALIANIWTGFGAETQVVEDTRRTHFDVIEGLSDPTSPITAAWLGL